MVRSQVVIALANLASKGKFEVTPAGSAAMNEVFVAVAELINELEAQEAEELAAAEETPSE